MRLLKFFFWLADLIARPGMFFKIRSSLGNGFSLSKFFPKASSKVTKLQSHERVVIVGAGISALTVAEELKKQGHEDVTLIHRDSLYGGKCVNIGCMPSEYFQIVHEVPPQNRLEKVQTFVGQMRKLTADRFGRLNYKLVQADVKEIRGKDVLLQDGQTLPFDRLILATGNKNPPAPIKTMAISDFWSLPSKSEGKNLVIVTDHNLTALSLADMAADLGFKTTVLFKFEISMNHLPSVQYYRRELAKRGIEIVEKADLAAASGDFVLNMLSPQPALPPIDGKEHNVFDMDFARSSVRGRDDIYLLGDAGGFLSATEAELSARNLIKSWFTGQSINMESYYELPLRVHGAKSLAMVGAPWTLALKTWNVVDFAELGWSLAHQSSGQLWYLLKDQHIQAIHICHPQASELISIAAALLPHNINDTKWLTCSVHPASSEIFKVVINDIENKKPSPRVKTSPRFNLNAGSITLPPVTQVRSEKAFVELFSPQELKEGILDSSPSSYFALLVGLKMIFGKDHGDKIILNTSPQGNYVTPLASDFKYTIEGGKSVVIVEAAGRSVTVALSEPIQSKPA